MTPGEPKEAGDRIFKLIGYGLVSVVGSTVVFAVDYQRPLDGFLIGLVAFILIWKTGLIDMLKMW